MLTRLAAALVAACALIGPANATPIERLHALQGACATAPTAADGNESAQGERDCGARDAYEAQLPKLGYCFEWHGNMANGYWRKGKAFGSEAYCRAGQ